MMVDVQMVDGTGCGTELEVTGVSVYNERGSELFDIQFLCEGVSLGILRTNVQTARMLRKALNTMTVLEQENERT